MHSICTGIPLDYRSECLNWHTCIPYALEYPWTIGVSAIENGSEGCLKNINYHRVGQTKNINRQGCPIDIHRRVVHKQKISIVGVAQLIFIGG